MNQESTATAVRDDGLDGQVALITGGASGIGRALAVAYARAGVRSIIGYYPGDPHDPAEAVAEVEAIGGQAIALPVDVRDYESVETLAKTGVEHFGQLNIAVAGAGILRRASLADMDDRSWDDLLAVDLGGVMRTLRAAASVMTGGGAMIAVSSIAGGVYGWEDHAHYATAKAGVLGLCRSLAVELAPRGIRVNAVIPGLIETPQSLDAVNSLGPDGLRDSEKSIPLRRVGRPDEAARVVRFLSGDDSSFITGQQILVDGGMTVQWPT